MAANDPVNEASDEALMLRYVTGEFTAFETLYARHRGGLYRFFLRQAGAAVAEELFQDVWMRVVQARARYQPVAKFSTWLYTLARNRLVDHWRRQGGSPVAAGSEDALEGVMETAPEPMQQVNLDDCIRQLLALVARLPALQRQAFLLRHEAGLSLAEIAETMESRLETAKSRLRYALDWLRRSIAPECLEE